MAKSIVNKSKQSSKSITTIKYFIVYVFIVCYTYICIYLLSFLLAQKYVNTTSIILHLNLNQ